MAWGEQWSITVDGTEVNDGVKYITTVPELETEPEMELILGRRDGGYPVAVRLQPTEGRYTFLVQMTPCDWATYQTRLTELRSIFANGARTVVAQVRGMASPKTVTVIVTGRAVEPKLRRFTATSIAPQPVLV